MDTEEEIPFIERIINDEKWLLGEELGKDPGDNHPLLATRVTRIILEGGEGKRMRETPASRYGK